MKLHIYPFLLLTCSLFCLPSDVQAQCAILDTAFVGMTLNGSSGGTNNRSGMVYNPSARLYYSVNAGNANYPSDTYNAAGVLLDSTAQGFDYRGAWWNPAAGQFEGNGFSAFGIFVQTLTAGTSYPSGTGATIFTANQPDVQSVGDLDYDSEEIIYYFNGFIHRYSRAANAFLGQYLITNLPVPLSEINSNTVVYTGCEGHEIGIYNHTNRRLLFVNKATGEYSGASQLPQTAPQRASFGVSYANNLLWIFNTGVWNSYQVVNLNTAIDEGLNARVRLFPNPASDVLRIETEAALLPGSIELMTLQGQVLLRRDLLDPRDSEIQVGHLPAGAYLARISAGGAMTVKKFIKH